MQLPDASSIDRTDAVLEPNGGDRAEKAGDRRHICGHGLNLLTGTNQTNAAVIFLPLKNFAERNGKPEQSAKALSAYLNEQYSHIQEAFSLVLLPPPVQGIGQAGGFKMQVEDRSGLATPQQLEAATQALIAEASKDPQIAARLAPSARAFRSCMRTSIASKPRRQTSPSPIFSKRCRSTWAASTSTTSITWAVPTE